MKLKKALKPDPNDHIWCAVIPRPHLMGRPSIHIEFSDFDPSAGYSVDFFVTPESAKELADKILQAVEAVRADVEPMLKREAIEGAASG